MSTTPTPEREHELSDDCWCQPRIEHVPATNVRAEEAEARAERAEAALREIHDNPFVKGNAGGIQSIARRALEQGDKDA